MNIMSTEIQKRFEESIAWLQKEYTGIRTGQANPGLLDAVKVESYGSYMPIQQLGSVGIEDARTLRVSMWDSSQVPAVEKAIRDADLGVSVMSDSAGLRIIFPELTSERRVQLLKLAKTRLEDARITVRSIRDEEMKDLEKEFKAGGMGEDDKFTKKDAIQKSVETTNSKLESLYFAKEKELQK
jgi:ribosome recycling factor